MALKQRRYWGIHRRLIQHKQSESNHTELKRKHMHRLICVYIYIYIYMCVYTYIYIYIQTVQDNALIQSARLKLPTRWVFSAVVRILSVIWIAPFLAGGCSWGHGLIGFLHPLWQHSNRDSSWPGNVNQLTWDVRELTKILYFAGCNSQQKGGNMNESQWYFEYQH